ncbi:MAG: ATP-dependent DNA helicase [Acidobacteriia bacterium]|nr:ATP-dependent DNA helicase [Terriglobia bacterium]
MAPAGPFFAPGGPLSRAHPAYEPRPGQEEMARAVERVFRDGGVLMVEAGTGTGKTLAYLVPAIESGRRVVVSTGTRNLQDQIFRKDLPFLRERAGWTLSACLMKGRDNYLCRQRFAEFDAQPMFEALDERKWLPKLRKWGRKTETGDRAEIADLPDGLRLWRDVNAKADTCTGRKCPEFEQCWLTKLKRRAEQSRILVVNHYLFFADLAVRSAFGAVLPDYDTVVFDEAHLLEEIATQYFGIQVSSGQVEDLARDAEALAAKAGGASKGGGGAAALRQAAREFFGVIRERLEEASGRVRFDAPDRGGPALEHEWALLAGALEDIAGTGSAHGDEAGSAVEVRSGEIKEALALVLRRSDPGYVYSLEARGRAGVILAASPIDVSTLLRESLFTRLHAAVLTSATLAVEGRFDFFQRRLGLEQCETRIVESPFDHEAQAVLYLPARMPEPKDRGWLGRALDEIHALLEITRGRAFLLFTSYAVMARVRVGLEREGSWTLFVQGEGSKAALVEEFKATEGAVLLGTTSFWHGVDVPGDALSLVVVDKLPFDVPADPLVAARIERILKAGGNPFAEYQTPLAVLELKQGLGRLLRSRSDRGILAVLDPRLTTRHYGRTFLASLPGYPVVRDLGSCRRFFQPGETP